jgi:hypothetical protein
MGDYSSRPGTKFAGDCTNYASQALLAGGWVMRHDIGLDWFYDGVRHSRSWTSAMYFEFFLKRSGRAKRCHILQALVAGDLILITPEGSDYANHVMMVTGFRKGEPLLSYHSSNYQNTPWSDVQARTKNTGVEFSYWKILDQYEDRNLMGALV